MGSLTISNKILDRYFGYLKNFDNTTKKNLIIKLTKSLEIKPKKEIDLKSLFGAWDDERNSDETRIYKASTHKRMIIRVASDN